MLNKPQNFPESDLLPVIKAHQNTIAPNTFNIIDEVESGHGRADIVFYNLDENCANLRRIYGVSRLKSQQVLETISIISRLKKSELNITQLYENLPYSEQYFRTKVLKFITKNHIGTFSNSGKFKITFKYKIAIRETVAIEAKVNNWKRGLFQAARYKRYAEYSYLALHEKFIHMPLRNLDLFEKMNVGLLSVDPNLNKIEILFKPKKEKKSNPKPNFFEIYTNESILNRLGFIGD